MKGITLLLSCSHCPAWKAETDTPFNAQLIARKHEAKFHGKTITTSWHEAQTYYVDGQELQAPNTRWAVVFLEQAHKHVREAFHTLENPLGIDKDWPAYHEALCIIENAMAELDGLAAQKYIR